jgi:hypothetical protein
MELKTFTEFHNLLDQVQVRKGFLGGELQAELDALQRKIDMKRREFNALEAALSGKARTGKIHEAARAVWTHINLNSPAVRLTNCLTQHYSPKLWCSPCFLKKPSKDTHLG